MHLDSTSEQDPASGDDSQDSDHHSLFSESEDRSDTEISKIRFEYGTEDNFENIEDFKKQRDNLNYYVSYRTFYKDIYCEEKMLDFLIAQCEGKMRRYEGTSTCDNIHGYENTLSAVKVLNRRTILRPFIDIQSKAEHAFLGYLPFNVRLHHKFHLNYYYCPLSGNHNVWENMIDQDLVTFPKCNCSAEMTGQELYEHLCSKQDSCRFHYLVRKFLDKVWPNPIPDPDDETERR